MIKSILAAAILSLGVVTVALAFTPSPATSPKLVVTSDLIQVKSRDTRVADTRAASGITARDTVTDTPTPTGTNTPRKAGATTTIVPIAGSIAAA